MLAGYADRSLLGPSLEAWHNLSREDGHGLPNFLRGQPGQVHAQGQISDPRSLSIALNGANAIVRCTDHGKPARRRWVDLPRLALNP